MTKPTVFNYGDYEKLKAENERLKEKLAERILCRDCRYSRIEGNTTRYRWCKCLNVAINDNDYCAYGERREP